MTRYTTTWIFALCTLAAASFCLVAGGWTAQTGSDEQPPTVAGTPASRADTGTGGEPTRRALLVGIESYSVAASNWSRLAGPHADVAALADALVARASFDPANIRTLLDRSATRRNILSLFEAMIEESKPGDVVLFYFSGHGSQLPDDDGDEASDAMDETLVPYDALRVDGTRNDIRDDEIQALIQRANERTDQVILIFDCCNSGTVTRSAGSLGVRYVPPPDSSTPTRSSRESMVLSPELSYVSLSACKSDQQAAEISLPGDGGQFEIRGIFSYFLVRQLYDMRPGWSYREFMNEVRAHVQTQRAAQTPILLGDAADGALFNGGAVATEPYFTLRRTKDGDRLDAGLVNSVVSGSVFHVQPSNAPSDTGSSRIGRIRVIAASSSSAEVEWLGSAPPLPDSGLAQYRAFEAERGPGETRLAVAVDAASDVDAEFVGALERDIASRYDLRLAAGDEPLLTVRVRRNGDTIALTTTEADGNALPIEGGDEDVGLFVSKIAAMGARHRLLLLRNDASSALCVQGSLDRVSRDRESIVETVSNDDQTEPMVFREGEHFRCRLKNCSQVPIYISMLIISPDGEIAVKPLTSSDEPLPPGRTIPTDVFYTQVPRGAEAFYELHPEVLRFIITRDPHDVTDYEQAPVTAMVVRRSFVIEPAGILSGKETYADSWRSLTFEFKTIPLPDSGDAREDGDGDARDEDR